MKIKEGYVLSEVAGSNVILPVGEEVINFNGMASLNSVGAFLFKLMQEKDVTKEQLVEALLEKYDVDEEKAKIDVNNFVNKIEGAGLVE